MFTVPLLPSLSLFLQERDLEHHMTQGEALFYQRQYEEAAASAHQVTIAVVVVFLSHFHLCLNLRSPFAQKALKLAEDLFGSGSVETLAPYILAGSAHLGEAISDVPSDDLFL